MNRAVRFGEEQLDNEILDYVNYSSPVIQYMRNYQNVSKTENGALGYKTTNHPLVDLNFMVSSLRNRDEKFIVKQFIKAYYESPKYAVKWLFFLRDIFEGMGERRTFRICMKYLADSHIEVAKAVMKHIPEYGRYDDLLVFLDTDLCEEVSRFIKEQIETDLLAMKNRKPISLLAKWLPSINTSSKEKRRLRNYKSWFCTWGYSCSIKLCGSL